MADKFYLNNRLKYHTASRVANQTGDSLAATFNVDGHIVRDSSVWTSPLSDFPLQSNKKNADPIGATENLVTVFKSGATSTTFWNGGLVWTNPAYPAVKLYENVTMTPVAASLGQNMNSGTPSGTAYYQAYEILAAGADEFDENGVQTVFKGISEGQIRVAEWIAPPAIVDPETGSPVAGYTGLQMLNGTALQKVTNCTGNDKWGLGGGHWEFVYMAGILTFEMGCTPQEIGAKSTEGITITAFKYDGGYLSANLTNINEDIIGIKESLGNVGQTLMAVKPFTWEADNAIMSNVYEAVAGLEVGANVDGYYELSGEEYALTEDDTAAEGKTYYQYVGKKIEIPAVVFNVFNAATGIAYGDIIYLEGGKTEVFFEGWDDTMFNGEKTFVAYGFVLGNGNPISVLESETLTKTIEG